MIRARGLTGVSPASKVVRTSHLRDTDSEIGLSGSCGAWVCENADWMPSQKGPVKKERDLSVLEQINKPQRKPSAQKSIILYLYQYGDRYTTKGPATLATPFKS